VSGGGTQLILVSKKALERRSKTISHTLEVSESKLASVAENFLRWFVVSISAHEGALLAAVNLFAGSFHNAWFENVVISDVTAHGVGH
jgi:2-phospho-L-lactate guanylyltransferase (CobY/MobA/RfbA family)